MLKNEYLCTLGSYHRDGVNKDKIILVSQAANIVSKYTAFVGVDKDTKVPVSTIKEKPEFDESMYRSMSLVCSDSFLLSETLYIYIYLKFNG